MKEIIDILQVVFVIGIYILVGYFGIKLISKWTTKFNSYIRLLILSFCYSLIWGIGFFSTGGDPGFAFPAPNIVALGFMGYNLYYHGFLNGLIILGIWWVIFFSFLLIKQLWQNRKAV